MHDSEEQYQQHLAKVKAKMRPEDYVDGSTYWMLLKDDGYQPDPRFWGIEEESSSQPQGFWQTLVHWLFFWRR